MYPPTYPGPPAQYSHGGYTTPVMNPNYIPVQGLPHQIQQIPAPTGQQFTSQFVQHDDTVKKVCKFFNRSITILGLIGHFCKFGELE